MRKHWHILPVLFFFVVTSISAQAQTVPPDSTCNCKWKTYYSNGKIKALGSFKNEKKHGTWAEYSQEGWIVSKTLYKKGKMAYSYTFIKGKKATRTDSKGRVKKFAACGCL